MEAALRSKFRPRSRFPWLSAKHLYPSRYISALQQKSWDQQVRGHWSATRVICSVFQEVQDLRHSFGIMDQLAFSLCKIACCGFCLFCIRILLADDLQSVVISLRDLHSDLWRRAYWRMNIVYYLQDISQLFDCEARFDHIVVQCNECESLMCGNPRIESHVNELNHFLTSQS